MAATMSLILIATISVLATVSKTEGRYLDMTHSFNDKTEAWPGNKKFNLTIVHNGTLAVSGGSVWFQVGNIELAEHSGTHMDAPAHFSKEAWRTDEIPVELLVRKAVMVDIRAKAAQNPDARLEVADITAWENEHGEIPDGAIVVMCSGWSAKFAVDSEGYWGTDISTGSTDLHFPGFHLDAVQHLVTNRNISAIVVDTASLDYGQSADFAVHDYMLPLNRYGVEQAKDTCKLPATGATLYVFPMKTEGGSGGPTRMVAIWDEQDDQGQNSDDQSQNSQTSENSQSGDDK